MLFFPFTQLYAFLPADTIILDGQIVQIERKLEVDTVWLNSDPPEELKSDLEQSWEFQFELGPRFYRYRSSSKLPELTPLEIFVEEPSRAVVGYHLGAEFRYTRNNKWSLRSGIGFANEEWRAADFNLENLNDSLFRFYSPESGVLKQIIRIRYPDLGAETDTLDLPFSTNRFRYASIEIPLIFTYIVPVREWGKSHHFEVGAGLINKILLFSRSNDLVLLNELGEFRKLKADELKLSSFRALGRAEIAWYYSWMRSPLTAGLRAYFQTPFTRPELKESVFELQGSESGLSVFLRVFIK